ncbi:hypothetical protein ACENW9_000827 [Escherichia coli]
MQQVKCTYSSNEGVFTPGLIYDVKIIYGNSLRRDGYDLAVIDDNGDIWRFLVTYRGGDVANADFSASFERY